MTISEIADGIERITAIDKIAVGDLHLAMTHLQEAGGSPFVRRQAFRAVFPSLEAVVYTLKSRALLWSQALKRPLSAGEDAMIQEVTFQLGQHGEVRQQSLVLNFKPRVRFALVISAKVLGVEATDFSACGWRDLNSAVETRNRLVHPRSVSDFEVSDSEFELLASGAVWFLDEAQRLSIAGTQALIEIAERAVEALQSAPVGN